MQRDVKANVLKSVPNWLHLTAQCRVLMLVSVWRLAVLTPVNKCVLGCRSCLQMSEVRCVLNDFRTPSTVLKYLLTYFSSAVGDETIF